MSGTVATRQRVALSELVLDPALQCRIGLNEAVVADYAAALLGDGAVFPPLKVIHHEEQLLVVDGWHRYHAHVRAGLADVEVEVSPGTRRDALLAAIQANTSHGLQRTMADKRRAVQALLRDEEWCGMSSRELARLASVSHTFVDETRKHYGVKKGEVLTEEWIGRVDGTPTGEWAELLQKVKSGGYQAREIEVCRKAAGPVDLLSANVYSAEGLASRALRRRELASKPWPWGEESEEARVARVAALGAEQDIVDALQARECPGVDGLYQVLQDVRGVAKLGQVVTLKRKLVEHAGRPKLVEALQARLAEVEVIEAARPKAYWEEQNDICGEKNPLKQSALVQAASAAALRGLQPDALLPVVRDGVYREICERGYDWQATREAAAACVVPGCGGWIRKQGDFSSCCWCGQQAGNWTAGTRQSLRRAAEVIVHPGYGFLADGIIIDRQTLDLLKALKTTRPSALVRMGGEVGKQLRAFMSRKPPEIIFVDPTPPPPKEPDVDVAYEDHELATELGTRAYAEGAANDAPAWVPADLHEEWSEGWQAGEDGTDADEEMDEAVAAVTAKWKEVKGE